MAELIAYCGIDCARCPAYIAKKNDDDGLRKKTAEEWSKMFNAEFKLEEINCDACTVAGQHIAYCDNYCEIRKCAIGKHVINCAYCEDYGCAILEDFLKNVPEARQRLEETRKNR